jgi:hypothetical protein
MEKFIDKIFKPLLILAAIVSVFVIYLAFRTLI